MENHFYHISWAPLIVTIFITHVRIVRNGNYAKDIWLVNSTSRDIILG